MTIDLDQITKARFIKLGRGAESIEQQCIALGKASIGFWSTIEEFHRHAMNREWREYRTLALETIVGEPGYNHMGLPGKKRHATSGANQVRDFFESDETTLWVTFHGQSLYYGVFDCSRPEIDDSLGGVTRKLLDGWSNQDLKGNRLYVDRLSGIITQIRIFRGASCNLKDSQVKYLKQRIAGEVPKYVRQIDDSREALLSAVGEAIQALDPSDFEVLVEILFSRSWRRIDRAGGSLRFVDITFEDPMKAGRTVGVQVKSTTSKSQIIRYLDMEDIKRYDHFYFVFHTLEGEAMVDQIDNDEVSLIDCAQLANLVVDSGLTNWLKEKTS